MVLNINRVGVVGAGVIGIGVTQALAQTGHHVVLLDISEEILAQAKRNIANATRFQTLFTSGVTSHSSMGLLERIHFSTDEQALQDVDFIIENVTERWDIKKPLYSRLDDLCRKHCVLAANTSAIPITRIASATRRPAQVVGMHFMNPVPLKTMVEVIRGYHTSEETLQTARHLLKQMGKDCIVVNDSPGFVSNRVMMLAINEAIFLLQDQVASALEVDTIFKTCFGHKMGPLETADLIGLDTVLLSIEVLHESFGEDKYRPCPLLQRMVEAGRCGRKTGHGFYTYE